MPRVGVQSWRSRWHPLPPDSSPPTLPSTNTTSRAAADSEREQEALLALAAQLAAFVEALDRVAADEQAMEAAAESFASLLQARSWAERAGVAGVAADKWGVGSSGVAR